MVTLRTYSNPAEAAIAKSVLDDHKIFCSLADENVNLYGGGPLAMPIRLLVAEDQAEEAVRLLETKAPELPADFDPGTCRNGSVTAAASRPDVVFSDRRSCGEGKFGRQHHFRDRFASFAAGVPALQMGLKRLER